MFRTRIKSSQFYEYNVNPEGVREFVSPMPPTITVPGALTIITFAAAGGGPDLFPQMTIAIATRDLSYVTVTDEREGRTLREDTPPYDNLSQAVQQFRYGDDRPLRQFVAGLPKDAVEHDPPF